MLRRATRQATPWNLSPSDNSVDTDKEFSPRRRRIRLQRLAIGTHPTLHGRARKTPLRRILYLCGCVSILLTFWYLYHRKLDTFKVSLTPELEDQPHTRTPPRRRPKLNRTALASLVGEDEEAERAHTSDQVSIRWPPLVTAIPEVHPSAQLTRIGLTTASVDAQFCRGQSHCRFLLPLWIGEQESKGQIHLTQILHLAAALNRTVVLPNVGKSRIGACGKWSFSAYYDTGSFARQLADIAGDSARVMLMDDFRTWVSMRPESPDGQLVFLREKPPSQSEPSNSTVILSDSEDGLNLYLDKHTLEAGDPRMKNAYCMKTKFRNLRLDWRHPLTLHAKLTGATSFSLPSRVDSFSAILTSPDILELTASRETFGVDPVIAQDTLDADMITSAATSFEPEVLMVNWDLRHLAFAVSPAAPALEYSEKLLELATLLAPPSEPYLAVHWRMETVQPDLLPDCAEGLIDTLSTLLADPTLAKGVSTVWLATDMPVSLFSGKVSQGPAHRSNTFKVITEHHAEAVEVLKTAFDSGGPLEEWRVTSLADEMQRVRMELVSTGREFNLGDGDDESLLWEDPGVWGILDKIVAMESTLFVSGSRSCGRVSSFTKQIVEYRTQGRGKDIPRNVVELFG